MYKDFLVGKLFRIVPAKGKCTRDLLSADGINYVAAKKTNNGIANRCSYIDAKDKDIISEGNCIVFVQLGDGSAGYTTYQPEDFVGMNGKIACGYIDGVLNEKIGMYLMATLDKNKQLFSYSASWTGDRLRNTVMPLPVKVDENGNPIIDDTHFYHDEGFVPDFDYMQERIAELEQERIAELEQYLIATGLNDYELTDEDKKILASSGFGDTQKRDSEDAIKAYKEMREFRCGNLFDIHPTKAYKMSNDKLYKTSGNSPVLSNSSVNNGIGGYCGLDTTEDGRIITFSDTTTGTDTMFYQPDPFIGYAHVQGMYPFDENWGEFQQRYFVCVMKQACGTGWDYSNKFNRKLVAEMTPLLPIQTDAEGNPIIDEDHKYHPDGYIPDWDFMEKYIKAIEKVVIADVVKYKDAVISKTKEIVA